MNVTDTVRIIRKKTFLMIRFFVLLLVLVAVIPALGQVQFQVAPDCETATELRLTRDQSMFRSQVAPNGFGTQQEMNASMGDSLWISREHHSSWLTWRSPFSGYLGLTITPDSLSDDYDFLLFRDTSSAGCEAIRSGKLTPERSLISRNDEALRSMTGLNGDMRVNYVAAGIGPSFGKAVKVEKGERWIMLVDNVYDDGGGFDLDFHYYYAPALAGKVVSASNDSPLVATISLLESPADTLLEQFDAEVTGRFATDRLFDVEKSYQLLVECEGFFPSEKTLTYRSLRANRGNPLLIKLGENRPGAILDLPQAHFQAGTAVFLSSAYAALDEMVALLAQYPDLSIRIDGHVNGVGTYDCEHNQSQLALSADRAIAVKQYLVRNGIAEERLTIKGWGCTKMIYPKARNEKEMAANRRVELVVQ